VPTWVGLTAAVLAFCGCVGPVAPRAPAAGRVAPAMIVPVTADASTAARQIAGLAGAADVVYLGEQHDNPADHAHQREILAALVAMGRRPALAFEMLDEEQQPLLDRAVAEARTAEELEQRLGWRSRGWPDFAMYWPLFDLAAREGLPVVALDLPPDVARRIAREGPASLGARAAALASLLPADEAREAAIALAIRDGHCGLLPEARLPAMVAAWHARNVTMARRIAAALERARPVVVIIGRGHQDAGGLPAQLDALRPGTRQLVVSMVELPAGERPGAVAAAAGGDVLWLTPAVERDDPCAGLRRSSG
jgi:uncharacterized iron-regulated protein